MHFSTLSVFALALAGSVMALPAPIPQRRQNVRVHTRVTTTTLTHTKYVDFTIFNANRRPRPTTAPEITTTSPPAAPAEPTTTQAPPPPPPPPAAEEPEVKPEEKPEPEPEPEPVVVEQPKPNTPPPAPKPTTTTAAPVAPKAEPTVVAPPPSSGNSEQDEVLAAHNKHRATHGSAPLSWDANLANMAKDSANACKFAHTNSKQNIGVGYSSYTALIDAFYDEEQYYDYATAKSTDPSKMIGHFTQIVWKSATKVGCAVTECANVQNFGRPGKLYFCNYDAGNLVGSFQANVLPPQ